MMLISVGVYPMMLISGVPLMIMLISVGASLI